MNKGGGQTEGENSCAPVNQPYPQHSVANVHKQ